MWCAVATWLRMISYGVVGYGYVMCGANVATAWGVWYGMVWYGVVGYGYVVCGGNMAGYLRGACNSAG